jgi:hypothetical protein
VGAGADLEPVGDELPPVPVKPVPIPLEPIAVVPVAVVPVPVAAAPVPVAAAPVPIAVEAADDAGSDSSGSNDEGDEPPTELRRSGRLRHETAWLVQDRHANEIETSSNSESSSEDEEPLVPSPRRPQRLVRPPNHLLDAYALKITIRDSSTSPTYKEAINGPDAEGWRAAMKEEYDQLVEMGTGVPVPPPRGRKVIGGRWVLPTKHDADGKFVKRKARWVALGYRQEPGIDYDETFASVIKTTTLRYILSLAALHDLELASFDVTGAFLAGELDIQDILVASPIGFDVPGQEGWVWDLRKPLYGLKQGPRCWKKALHDFLTSFGMIPSYADDCLYTLHDGTDFLYLTIHVDDGILASNSVPLLHRFRDAIRTVFKTKWTSDPTLHLGFNINRDRAKGTLRLSQQTYLTEVVEHFDLADCNTAKLPISPSVAQDLAPATDVEVAAAKHLPYRNLLGKIAWAANGSRPDIAFAANFLARSNTRYSHRHFAAAKGLLRYLAGILDYAITFRTNGPPLTIYSDADYAGCVDSSRSTGGYVVVHAGGAICWSLKRQDVVSLSTTESEYIALGEAATQTIWLRRLIASLDRTPIVYPPTTILGDNQGSLYFAKDPVNHRRAKHIAVRHHWMREKIADGELKLEWVSTKENAADVLTKSLDIEKHYRFTKGMGMGIASSGSVGVNALQEIET